MVTLSDVEAARARIRESVYLTPCAHSVTLSRMLGCDLYLKLENLQMTGAFKERGARNRLLLLSEDERRRGVITASAGNHGQALAFHAGQLGVKSVVVMPEGTPLVKIDSTRGHGAEVVLAGGSFDDAVAHAHELEAQRNLIWVSPFDDEAVIAGQGTIALEILEQVPDVEVVVSSVGGGGLLAGMGVVLGARAPHVKLIGVQAARVPSMKAAFDADGPVTTPPAVTLADGIAVRRAGVFTYPLVRKHAHELVTATDGEIANAILLLLENEKTVAEGAGAAALAALLHDKVPLAKGRRTVAVVSGGNIDVNLMSRIIERGLVKSGRLIRLAVRVPDQVGVLADVAQLVGALRANILEVSHQRAWGGIDIGQARVELVLETRGFAHGEEIVSALRTRGYDVVAAS